MWIGLDTLLYYAFILAHYALFLCSIFSLILFVAIMYFPIIINIADYNAVKELKIMIIEYCIAT